MAAPVYRVDVFRSDEDDELEWGGEGGLDESSSGVEFDATDDLAEFADQVREEVARHRRRYPDLTVKWTLDGGAPDEFIRLAAEQGVVLP